jgi:hypothetical protein
VNAVRRLWRARKRKKMPQCKGCGQTTVWNKQHQQQTGKWTPHDPDTGLPHDCPAYQKQDKYIDTKPQERDETKATAQGPTRYESSYLIPKEEWERLLENSAKITAQLERLSEFYDSVMQEIEALRNLAYEQQSYRKRQQQLAKQEEAYDTAKEDGTIGFG